MSISYQIILMDMTVNEVVTENEDGSYTIFINSRMNYEKQMKAYLHAMKHITGDDFQKEDVQSIEYRAHG
ncbi:MAG: hypothetical protein Q4C84_02465 [Bacillota bacterium]|nr:hypothetical protein [Bacillota bacterium]